MCWVAVVYKGWLAPHLEYYVYLVVIEVPDMALDHVKISVLRWVLSTTYTTGSTWMQLEDEALLQFLLYHVHFWRECTPCTQYSCGDNAHLYTRWGEIPLFFWALKNLSSFKGLLLPYNYVISHNECNARFLQGAFKVSVNGFTYRIPRKW